MVLDPTRGTVGVKQVVMTVNPSTARRRVSVDTEVERLKDVVTVVPKRVYVGVDLQDIGIYS